MKNFTLLTCLFLLSFGLSAQTVVNLTCSDGTFVDSGGAASNYQNDENYQYNICPDNPGDAVSLQFTSITTENSYDTLHIYDGQVIDYNSTRLTPFGGLEDPSASFTSSTPDGCLTAVFISDYSNTEAGWEATITCIPPCPFSSAAPIYVDIDATGNNDGTSWADAFTDLQPALDAYCNNADIWVAEGTYLPTESPDETTSDARNKAFHFDTDIKIYGGFDGTETMLTQRDASANPTILSGDFNNDDVVTGGGSTLSITNNTENAYHVLVTINLSNAAILDGFAIQGGNTDGTSGIAYGGLNISPEGGGMYNFSSSPTLTNVTFSQNNAGSQGGGMYNISSSSPTLTNVTFSQNNASFAGGGGMYNYFSSSPTLTNVTFSQNNAGSDGGGMYNENNSSPTLTNVTFSQNNASFAGGGMFNFSSSPTLTNVTFSQNNAGSQGGGMYNYFSSPPTLYNTLFYANTAGTGAGIDITGTGDINSSSSHNASDATGGGISTGTGFVALTASPFVDSNDPDGSDDIWMTADDGLALLSTAPVVNAGTTPTPAVATDILGNSRVGDYDIGAYEYTIVSCTDPSTLNATNITDTAADLSWTENGTATTWNIEYGTNGYTQGTGTAVNGVTNPYSLTGLTANTSYDYYVQADCGGSQSAWVGPYSFSTKAANTCNLIVNPSGESGASTGWTIVLQGLEGVDCYGNSDWQIQGGQNGFPSAQDGSSYFYCGCKDASFTPGDLIGEIYQDIDVSAYQVNIDAGVASFTFSGYLQTWSNGGGDDEGRMTLEYRDINGTVLNTYDTGNQTSISTWTQYTDTRNAPTGTRIIRVILRSYIYQDDSVDGYFDDLSLTTTTILNPSTLNATNITDTAADLSWTENGTATTWNIEYGTNGYTQGTGTAVNGVTNPYSLTGLTASTSYDYYVQSDCGGSQSAWVGPYSFSTKAANTCNLIVNPSGESGASTGWTIVLQGLEGVDCYGNSDWQIQGGQNGFPSAQDGSSYFYCGCEDASFTPGDLIGEIYQDIDVSAYQVNIDAGVASFTFSGYLQTWSNGGGDDEGRMTLEYRDINGTVLNTYDTGNQTSISTWTQYTDTRNAPTGTRIIRVILRSYIYQDDSVDGYFDDLSLTTTTILNPSTLNATNITDTAADLSWTENGTATTWNIEYGTNGYTQGTGTAVNGVTNPYSLTGLTANTSYDYYVQADCGGSQSAWVGPFNFTTIASCPPITTYGYTDCPSSDVGSYSDGFYTGQAINLSQSSTITDIGVCIDATASPGLNIIVGIYSDNSGTPDVRLAETALITLVPGNNDMSLTSPIILSPDTYWVITNHINTVPVGIELGTNTSRYYAPTGGATTLPANMPTGFFQTTEISSYHLINNPGSCSASSPLITAAGSYQSTQSSTDVFGWTHFCTCEGDLLLSMELGGTGAVIPDDGVSIEIGATAATYHPQNTGFITNPDGAVVMNRSWDVQPSIQPTSDVNVRFYYTDTEYQAINTELSNQSQTPLATAAEMWFFKATSGAAHDDISNIPTAIVLENDTSTTTTWYLGTHGASDHYAEYRVASFSGGGGGGSNGGGTALPVELTYFQARKEGKTARLTWETASEQNNKGFHVEHSANGRDFETIGWIDGHGNTTEVQEYEFIHEKPNTGVNYYRLTQEDFDGTISYSDIRTVLFEVDFGIRVYPNPSKLKGSTNIQLMTTDAQAVTVNVFEMNGRQVMSMNHDINEGNNILSLPHDLLSNGVYIISITHDDGTENVKLSIVE